MSLKDTFVRRSVGTLEQKNNGGIFWRLEKAIRVIKESPTVSGRPGVWSSSLITVCLP